MDAQKLESQHFRFYLITIIVLQALAFSFLVIRRLFFSPHSHVPGPLLAKLSRYWIVYFDLRLQRPQKVAEWHRKYGPIVLIAPEEVSIAEPCAMREIYSSSSRHEKSHYFDHFVTHNSRSIFAEKGYNDHRQKRRLTSAFYQPTSILKPSIEEHIRGRVVAVIDQIERQLARTNSVDIFPQVNNYAWDNITHLVYGPRHCSHSIEHECYERSLLQGLKQTELWSSFRWNLEPLFKVVMFIGNLASHPRKLLSADNDLNCWSTQRLADSASDPGVASDHSLLRRLREAKDADGQLLSSNYIACEVLDNLHAAQATITVALTYIIYHLTRNEEWQCRLREEISSLPKEADGFPLFVTINAAPILEACIRESYRLNPVSSGRAERVIPTGKEYAGVFLPENTIVSASTLALHYDSEVFSSPEIYDPNRWLNVSPDQLRRQEMNFIPFGYGARVCLGKAFSTLEIKLLVTAVFLKFSTRMDTMSGTTTEKSMQQLGSQDALPKGLRCDVLLERLC